MGVTLWRPGIQKTTRISQLCAEFLLIGKPGTPRALLWGPCHLQHSFLGRFNNSVDQRQNTRCVPKIKLSTFHGSSSPSATFYERFPFSLQKKMKSTLWMEKNGETEAQGHLSTLPDVMQLNRTSQTQELNMSGYPSKPSGLNFRTTLPPYRTGTTELI